MRFDAVVPPVDGDTYDPAVAERIVAAQVTPTGGRIITSSVRDDGSIEVTIEYDDDHPVVKGWRETMTEFSLRGSATLPYDAEVVGEWVDAHPGEIARVRPAEPPRDPYRAAVARFFRRG